MGANNGKHGDRVKDTVSSFTSTTAVNLTNSAPTGFQTFGTFYANADVCPSYTMVDTTGQWETSYGAYTAAGTKLARAATPIASSNAGAQIVTFSGTVTIFCSDPAVNVDMAASGIASGNIYPQYNQGTVTGTNSLVTGTVHYEPVVINQWFSSVNIHFNISTLAAGTSTMAVGLYTNLNGQPNARLGQATGLISGTQGGGATGDNATGSIAMSSPQPPGLYWVAYVSATTAPTLLIWAAAANQAQSAAKNLIGMTDTTAVATLALGWTQTNATLPNPAASLALKTSNPHAVGVSAVL